MAEVIADWKKTPGTVGIRIILTQEANRTPDDPDLDRICRAFLSVLSGVFHERIEYPEIEIPPRSTPEEDRARTVAPETETEGHENDR